MFRIDFEHSLVARPYAGLAGRAAFDQLLTPTELETVVEFQKKVIRSLSKPPTDWIEIYPAYLRETYAENFDPDCKFTPGDFWHRFLTVDHVAGWSRLIASLLPAVLARAELLTPGVMYVGSTIDLAANPLQPTNPHVLKRSVERQDEPPDLAWRPASRRQGANVVCGICGKAIGPTDITAEKVGYPGIFHFECRLREMASR